MSQSHHSKDSEEQTQHRGDRSMDSLAKPSHLFAPMSSEMPLPDLGVSNRSLFQGRETSMFQNSDSLLSMSAKNIHHAPQDANEMMNRFYIFLNEFEKQEESFQPFGNFRSQGAPKTFKPYLRQLERLQTTQNQNLYLNCDDLFQEDQYCALYKLLVWDPENSLLYLDVAARALFLEMHPNTPPTRQIRVVPYNLATTRLLRELGSQYIVSLVQVEGIVIRMSNITPTLNRAHFRCSVCQNAEKVKHVGGRIQEPNTCKGCNQKWSMDLIHDMSDFIDRQTIKLQEIPENVPQGETPMSVIMVTHGDMVDQVRPGDRVKVVGILRAESRRLQTTRRNLRALFENFLDVISFTRLNARKQLKLGAPGDDMGFLGQEKLVEAGDDSRDEMKDSLIFSRDEVATFRQLAQDPNLYNKLAQAIAPSIFECTDVKKGLLLQLFGAREKKFTNLGRGRFRNEINILLIGDPSTAKSQLLQFVNKISPRGIYTSGKSSSAVGLTAYVKRDPELNQPVLESGALVLSDRGICCIDEFDKMSENARSVLHEVMEQQTVSIAKAGIVCQLNARAAVLAAANPVFSRYNPNLTVVKNLNLPPSLLSRFDLIYLMLDPQNSGVDRQLSKHIISMYTRPGGFGRNQDELRDYESPIEPALLCAYVSYARNSIHPTLTDEAAEVIRESYMKMRNIGARDKTISATTRQIESLVRLAEARARMRLAQKVTVEDAKEAVRLMEVATQRAATTKDGKIDLSRIQSGIDEKTRTSVKDIVDRIQRLLQDHAVEFKKGVKFQQLREHIQDAMQESRGDIDDLQILYALYELELDEKLMLIGNRNRPTVKTSTTK